MTVVMYLQIVENKGTERKRKMKMNTKRKRNSRRKREKMKKNTERRAGRKAGSKKGKERTKKAKETSCTFPGGSSSWAEAGAWSRHTCACTPCFKAPRLLCPKWYDSLGP